MVARDQREWDTAVAYYNKARTLAETFEDQRGAVLWTLNMGVALYEQGQPDKALPLLTQGRDQAGEQGSRSLEAGDDPLTIPNNFTGLPDLSGLPGGLGWNVEFNSTEMSLEKMGARQRTARS